MACKYIVTVRDPIDQVQSHFYYQLGGEQAKINLALRSEKLHILNMVHQVEAYQSCVNDTGDSLWCAFIWDYLKYVSKSTRETLPVSRVIDAVATRVYLLTTPTYIHLWLQHIKREDLLVCMVQLEDMKGT